MSDQFFSLPIDAKFSMPPLLMGPFTKTSATTYGLSNEPLWEMDNLSAPVTRVDQAARKTPAPTPCNA